MEKVRGKGHRRRFLPSPLITVVAGLAVTALLTGMIAHLDAEYNKEVAYRTAQVYGTRIGSLLDSLFHKTDVLASVIISDEGVLSEETFIDVAKSLMVGEGIRAIQYQPGGTTQYVYPLEGNEVILNANVFDNPTRRDDALLAVETKQVELSDPSELKQGGLGMIARDPVYMTNDSGQEEFWGFATIVLDLPQALDPIMLHDLEKDGYRYELSSRSNSGDSVRVASSGQLPGDDSVSYQISVSNHEWTLKLAPSYSWARAIPLVVVITVGIVISLLLALVARLVRARRLILHKLAITDELTGLHNRRWFSQEITNWCADTGTASFAVFFLDLDGFKTVNDTMGHQCGDELLRKIAARLIDVCDEGDVLARLGGDEFVVARCGVNREQAQAFAEELEQAIARPITACNREWTMLVSIGIALFPDDGTDYEALTHVADTGMYRQKQAEGAVGRTGL
ncbi:sensor domain-containing diguanylate cyclase [Gordonibacter sp.]|uniref:sensor domain-containing diguanylate cyclase n=1 Tax=Gordonibacter sp. TaxID=1968902 RepID=UPI002FC5B1ED